MQRLTSICVLLVLLTVALGRVREKVKNNFRRSRATNPSELVRGRQGSQLDFEETGRRAEGRKAVVRFQQTYRGIPIRGAQVSARLDQGGKMDGTIFGEIDARIGPVNTVPSIPKSQAKSALKAHWKYSSNPTAFTFKTIDKTTKLIMTSKNGTDILVWSVSFFVEQTTETISTNAPSPAWIKGYVSAHTGKVEQTYNQINEAAVNAVMGNSGPAGQYYEEIEVIQKRSKCEFLDTDLRVSSFNLRNRPSLQVRTKQREFRCSKAETQTWDFFRRTEGYSPRSEAFHFAGNLVKMYREELGSDPHDDNAQSPGYYLQQLVHYGRNYENAFYNGEYYVYGDGAPSGFLYPLTSQDIVCHEIGHGITHKKGADLEYIGESGGMNEAYSDMTGEACDFKYYGRENMIFGDLVSRQSLNGGEGFRDMCNPARWGSLDHLDQYVDQGVHTTSGIYNKAFCTLSRSPGWNIIKAWKLFTLANLNYWTSTSTMNCGACGVLEAAVEMKENRSPIEAAFATVGVDCDNCV